MTQQVLVTLIVVAAVCVSIWKLMPARQRLRLLLAVDGWCAGYPALAGWRQRTLKPRIARAAGSGCDGCGARDMRPPHLR